MSDAATRKPRLARIPALDGLRGLAVVAVLLFHGGLSWATGGFLGVDVFFVLSGFLITSLLLAEQRSTGTIGLGGFWARRARRLLPALLLVIAAVAAATSLFDPSSQVSLRADALAALGYVANWRFVAEGADYFGRTAADSPLNHLWSLAIEEQFYLFWPLVVLAVARGRRAATWVGVAAATGAVASVAAMVLLHRSADDVSRVYYGTDTRVHTVLIGAALAALLAPRPIWAGAAAGWPGAAGLVAPPTAAGWPRPLRVLLAALAALAAVNLVAGVALVDGGMEWLYEGGLPIFSVAAAVLIAAAVLTPDGLVARALALEPLGSVGRLSYGLYLWHWPLYLLLTSSRTGLSGPDLLVVRLVATFAAAAVSDRLLERPIREGRLPGWRAGAALPVAGAATAAIVLFVTLGVAGSGAPDAETALRSGAPLGPPVTATPSGALPRSVPVRTRAPGEPVKVLALGDSVALTLAQPLVNQGPNSGITLRHAALLGCGVARGGPLRYVGDEQEEPPACPTWPAQWSQSLKLHDPDVVLILIGRWEVVDRFWQGRWTSLGDPEFDRYIETELAEAVATATERGARVALNTAPYYSRGEQRDGSPWPEDNPLRVDRLNQLVRQVAARHPGVVTVIDLGARTAKAGAYTRSLHGVQMRYDGVHFTPVGARSLAPWLLPQLEALGPTVVPGQPTSTVASTTTTTTTRPPGRVRR